MPRKTSYTDPKKVAKALGKLPRLADRELTDATKDIASRTADAARSRARALGGVATLVAGAIRAQGNAVVMDGSASLRDGPRQTIADVMWGAEFGSGRYSQFMPYRAGTGYILYGTLAAGTAENMDTYSEALDDALQVMR